MYCTQFLWLFGKIFMMDNALFITHLTALRQDRFALNALPTQSYHAFLSTLLAHLSHDDINTWYLLGTDGCHLCDDTAMLMQRLNIDYVFVDIADADELIIDSLGQMIPIVLTAQGVLCYPFGIMDLMTLSSYKK